MEIPVLRDSLITIHCELQNAMEELICKKVFSEAERLLRNVGDRLEDLITQVRSLNTRETRIPEVRG